MRSTLGNFEKLSGPESESLPGYFPVGGFGGPAREAGRRDYVASRQSKPRRNEGPGSLRSRGRLEILNEILNKEIEILTIEQDINIKVRSQINKTQREYYLKEQMRAIQEELGQDEAIEDEIDNWLNP
jgi:ATP-dependent Lon protease